jgi:hypothetical protein
MKFLAFDDRFMNLFRVNDTSHGTGYVEILVDRVDVVADKLTRRCAEMKENVLEDLHDNRETRAIIAMFESS